MSLIRRSDKGQPLSAADHDANLKRLGGFASLPALLAERSGYDFWREGEIITTHAEGFRYRVVTAEGSSGHLVTAGGVRLAVLPTDDGALNFRAFAPAANGRADDHAKLMLAIEALPAGGTLFFPDGTYFIGKTVFFKKVVHLKGTRSGLSDGASAVLAFPANTTGLKFERHNTYDGKVETTPSGASDGSIVEGLWIRGTLGVDKTKHGIHAVCRILIRNCKVSGFSGDGVHIYGASDQCGIGGHQAICGNANLVQIYTSQALGNGGNGFYLRGYDGNAGYCYGLDAAGNGRWGIVDLSFLGNTHIGHHVATNGVAVSAAGNPAGHSSFVHVAGIHYSTHPDATEQQLVDTQPGSNPAIWVATGAGGAHSNIPTWLPGQPVGTYFVGGSFYVRGNNARNVLLGCYTEGGAGGSFIEGPSIVEGGMHGAGFIAGGAVSGRAGDRLELRSVTVGQNGITTALPGQQPHAALQWGHTEDSAWPWALTYSNGNWAFQNGGLSARVAAYITSVATTLTFGTSAAIGYIFGVPVLGLGSGLNARRMTNSTTAPSTGNWARGDIVWNINAAAGGSAGWICVAAGSPGTWKTFAPIAS